MFLVTSTYLASSEAIQHRLPEHRAWIDTHYANGTFFLSGRLVPPTGGFMLVRGISRDDLEGLLATDPFRLNGLLAHTIVELAPTRAALGLNLEDLGP
ncbi:YciI family protein [Lichenifustis flavocetrariae]|uniref:GTP cyclohydrolase n=1 Tax=Lichenifustis flavocetrariae TaxID=2949735 RepID=A0AA41ZA88_9HYPH|nr:YciI family protein [Lichenifustis flavocetrariae]MCW6512162.1 GTP cyclohydrolase [Lichenifustis flavocetrariae]